jgi:hypothetical protein
MSINQTDRIQPTSIDSRYDITFSEKGVHQIIVKLNTKDSQVALASFDIPVIRFWWNSI